jgi:hypothetical protein
MDEPSDGLPAIGWLRAILTAAIVVVVGIAVCVYIPNAILTRVHSLNRGNLVGIATTVFFVGLFAMAWALRWLQRRKVL